MERAKLLLLGLGVLLLTGLSFANSHGTITAGMRIDPAWLACQEVRDKASCTVCHMVLQQPTTSTCCPEGRAACRQCYVTEMCQTKCCPLCENPTDESRLQRCLPLEGFIGQLQLLRCKHGPATQGGGGGGAAPLATLEPAESTSIDRLREELGRWGLFKDIERSVLVASSDKHCCNWGGKVCELQAHLAESCAYEPVPCPNAAAGCQEPVLRKDAASHASDTCEYRQSKCGHCSVFVLARDLPEHEGSCPEAHIECPNAGCGETVARRSMAEHRGLCGREDVGCPCPGCDERMARAEVEKHMAASGAVHLRRAWGRAVEMEEKVAGLQTKVAEQGGALAGQAAEIKTVTGRMVKMEEKVAGLLSMVVQQDSVIARLQQGVKCVTRVFTWSTDRAWSQEESLPFLFMDGVRGSCFNNKAKNDYGHKEKFMGFMLEEGSASCTMHYTCSILDKNDQVLRVVSTPENADFLKPPGETAKAGVGRGACFDLTKYDKAGAVRVDGSIKLRMVVHLYLPE